MIDEETYNWYMEEIQDLMDKDKMSEREAYWLEEMAGEVMEYEEYHWSMNPPTQEAAKEFRHEQGENK